MKIKIGKKDNQYYVDCPNDIIFTDKFVKNYREYVELQREVDSILEYILEQLEERLEHHEVQ